MKKRIKEIQNILKPEEAALITSDIGRRYLIGFNSSAGSIVITKDEACLFIDFRYFERAKATVKTAQVVMAVKTYTQINQFLREKGINTVYLETDRIDLDTFKRIKKELPEISVSEDSRVSVLINQLRQIKAAEEVESIKEAQRLTDLAFEYILTKIQAGVTEKEIALDLEFFMRKNGSEGTAFDVIAVSGKNSSLPHGVPSDNPIEKGDFLTLDFGAVVDGYRSDMTRTVGVGKLSEEQRSVYDIVLKAQLSAISEIRSGKVCKDIDSIARNIISDCGYKDCFGHGLGHSVGLEIHESPNFNTRDESLLKNGMIITVEPGIYIENRFGVRIEDMVLVTENACENLTKSPKELIIC